MAPSSLAGPIIDAVKREGSKEAEKTLSGGSRAHRQSDVAVEGLKQRHEPVD